jgi:hypothetical protein
MSHEHDDMGIYQADRDDRKGTYRLQDDKIREEGQEEGKGKAVR